MNLPDKVRITNCGWNEDRGAYKAQIGTNERTIAYAWVPSSVGGSGHEEAMRIAERICEGWNAQAQS